MGTEQPKNNPINNIPIEKRHTWKPGESGNPGGRHKDPKTTWRMWLAEKGLLLAGDKGR